MIPKLMPKSKLCLTFPYSNTLYNAASCLIFLSVGHNPSLLHILAHYDLSINVSFFLKKKKKTNYTVQ